MGEERLTSLLGLFGRRWMDNHERHERCKRCGWALESGRCPRCFEMAQAGAQNQEGARGEPQRKDH
jgi:hypothetical protein